MTPLNSWNRYPRLFNGVVLSLTFLALFGAQIVSNWWTLRITEINGGEQFLDLRLVLDSVKCFEEIGDRVYEPYDGFECSGYIYGKTLLRIFATLNIQNINLILLGTTLTATFLILASLVTLQLAQGRLSYQVLGICIFFSPSCWLLIERGNLDILIFVLVFFTVYFLEKQRDFLSVILLGVGALLKFYTLPMMLLIIPLMKKRRSRNFSSVTFFIVFITVALEILRIPRFPSTWYVSFGNQALGHWWNLLVERVSIQVSPLGNLTSSALGFIPVLLIVAILLQFRPNDISEINRVLRASIERRNFSGLWFFISAGVYFFCYFGGMSFDYRLFYLGISGLALLSLISGSKIVIANVYVGLSIGTLWFSCFFFGMKGIPVVIIELFGDVMNGICISIILALAINHILQISKFQRIKRFGTRSR